MVNALRAIIAGRLANLVEFAGSALVVLGIWRVAVDAGIIAAGVCLVLKSMELDLRAKGDKPR